jgi:hypothetical protein
MSELQALVKWIEQKERSHSGKSPYEFVNLLRGYTKPAYTTPAWTLATGYQQAFIDGSLNQMVELGGQITDFGHFIASLSDQINPPSFKLSSLTRWTADHTSWAGDIGSTIAAYRAQPGGKIGSLKEALALFASDSDYAADVAAFIVGSAINSGNPATLSQLIGRYDIKAYVNHVRTFIANRFLVSIIENVLQSPEKVEAEIRHSVFTYLALAPNAGAIAAIRNRFSTIPKLPTDFNQFSLATDLLQGSLHFLAHLVNKGELEPVSFHPYKLPKAPWLGSVSYVVSLPA